MGGWEHTTVQVTETEPANKMVPYKLCAVFVPSGAWPDAKVGSRPSRCCVWYLRRVRGVCLINNERWDIAVRTTMFRPRYQV